MSETQSTDNGYAMKGIAILVLMLHNLLHKCGFSLENEWEYIPERTSIFLHSLANCTPGHFVGELLSFAGWTCICVFAFLSGYGLEKKYGSRPLNARKFIGRHWLKLFVLMLPGTLFFVFAHWHNCGIRYLLSLTMLANLVDSDLLPVGIYWYFGFTFELYLLWLLIRKVSNRYLPLIMAGFVALQMLFVNSCHLEFIRMNFLGWGQIFLFGMIVARSANLRELNVALGIVAAALVPISCLNKWTWLILTPFLTVAAIWSLASFVVKWQFSKAAFTWVGKLSALLFAIHPVMRAIVLKIGTAYALNLYLIVAIYLVCSFVIAVFAKKAMNWSHRLRKSLKD